MVNFFEEMISEKNPSNFSVPIFHDSFSHVNKKVQTWISRFPDLFDESIIYDLQILFLTSTKKYLDHRHISHLFRIVLSIHQMQKKLQHEASFTSNIRHIKVRSISTLLHFPFSSKPVLGYLIGFNTLDRYEIFDEHNLILVLQKHFPDLRLVKESSYHHMCQDNNLKFFYFEIEKKNGKPITLKEKKFLNNNIEEKSKK